MNDDNATLHNQGIENNSDPIDDTAAKANRWREFKIEKDKTQKSSVAKWGTLIATLVLFVILGGIDNIWITLTALVPVILLHELSHLVAMRLSGYTDLSVFFIPMLGAAAMGKEQNPTQTKRAFVALAGPLTGIILGVVLLVSTDWNKSDFLTSVIQSLFMVNLFNLLPIRPLDGGHIIEALVMSRSVIAAILFAIISPLLLCMIAVSSGDFVLFLFATLVILTSIGEVKLIRIVGALRKQGFYSKSVSLNNIPDLQLLSIVERIKERFKNIKDDALAAMLERIISRMGVTRASVGATVGMMSAYLGTILFGTAVYLFGYMSLAQDDPKYQGQRISEWVLMLKSADLETQKQAEQVLRQAITQTEDYMIRNGAITTIGKLGPLGNAAVPILYNALEKEIPTDDSTQKTSDDPYHVQNLVRALSNIGPGVLESAPEAPLLIGRCLLNPDPYVRTEAAIALANIGVGNTTAVALLSNAILKEREESVKQEMEASMIFLTTAALIVETDAGPDSSIPKTR